MASINEEINALFEAAFRSVVESPRLPIGPTLLRHLGDWGALSEGLDERRWRGPIGSPGRLSITAEQLAKAPRDWRVESFAALVRGRAKAIREYARRRHNLDQLLESIQESTDIDSSLFPRPGRDAARALRALRQVYDFKWPEARGPSLVFYRRWGWLQIELDKPGARARRGPSVSGDGS